MSALTIKVYDQETARATPGLLLSAITLAMQQAPRDTATLLIYATKRDAGGAIVWQVDACTPTAVHEYLLKQPRAVDKPRLVKQQTRPIEMLRRVG